MGVFRDFLNCANGTKQGKVSHILQVLSLSIRTKSIVRFFMKWSLVVQQFKILSWNSVSIHFWFNSDLAL